MPAQTFIQTQTYKHKTPVPCALLSSLYALLPVPAGVLARWETSSWLWKLFLQRHCEWLHNAGQESESYEAPQLRDPTAAPRHKPTTITMEHCLTTVTAAVEKTYWEVKMGPRQYPHAKYKHKHMFTCAILHQLGLEFTITFHSKGRKQTNKWTSIKHMHTVILKLNYKLNEERGHVNGVLIKKWLTQHSYQERCLFPLKSKTAAWRDTITAKDH